MLIYEVVFYNNLGSNIKHCGNSLFESKQCVCEYIKRFYYSILTNESQEEFSKYENNDSPNVSLSVGELVNNDYTTIEVVLREVLNSIL